MFVANTVQIQEAKVQPFKPALVIESQPFGELSVAFLNAPAGVHVTS